MAEDSQIFIFSPEPLPEPHIQLDTTDSRTQVIFSPPASRNHWEKEMSDELTSSNSDSMFISFCTPKYPKQWIVSQKNETGEGHGNENEAHKEYSYQKGDTKAESWEPFQYCQRPALQYYTKARRCLT